MESRARLPMTAFIPKRARAAYMPRLLQPPFKKRCTAFGQCLSDLCPALDLPGMDDFAVSNAVGDFVEINGWANVIGDNVQAIADGKCALGIANVDIAVLF